MGFHKTAAFAVIASGYADATGALPAVVALDHQPVAPALFGTGLARQASLRTAHRHAFEYTPRPGYLYVRSRAISSRCNDNYDEFPSEEIKAAYASFVGKPVFVNHHNSNHRRARGVIIDAALHEDTNPDGTPDTWCEVLMEVDAVRFPKLAEAVISGAIDRTSMGTDVAYSVCTACNNRASNPAEYCAHIPRMKGQRITRRTASGQQEAVLVAERCYGLRFFENSLLVEQPADPTAYTFGVDTRGLSATASINARLLREVLAEAETITKQAWDESEHPRGHEGNPGEFRSKDQSAAPSQPKAQPKAEPPTLRVRGPVSLVPPYKPKDPPHGSGTKADPVVTDDVEAAAEALMADKYVRLSQPRVVSTLVDHLADLVQQAREHGGKVRINLCLISVPKTNLFCEGNKGYRRFEMPQMKSYEVLPGSKAETQGHRLPDGQYDLQSAFRNMLQREGVKITDEVVPAAVLKATQSELDGAKVASMLRRMEDGRPPSQEPIFVSNDGYILDGHHRWASQVASDARDNRLGNSMEMPVHVIDLDIGTLYRRSMDFIKDWGIPTQDMSSQPPAKAASWESLSAVTAGLCSQCNPGMGYGVDVLCNGHSHMRKMDTQWGRPTHEGDFQVGPKPDDVLFPVYASLGWGWDSLGKTAELDPVEVAGLAIQAADTGRILMIQRSFADKEDPARGTWEFPGGHLDDGEHPPTAALREFTEEVGCAPPHGDIVGSWRSGPIYQGFHMLVPTEGDVDIHCRQEGRATNPDDPHGDDLESVAWWLPEDARKNPALRSEVKSGTDWSIFKPYVRKATASRGWASLTVTATALNYQVGLECGDTVRYVGSQPDQVQVGQDWRCSTHGETTVSQVSGEGATYKGLGFDKHAGLAEDFGEIVEANLGRCYELSAERVAFGPGGDEPFGGYKGAHLVHGTIQNFGMQTLEHAWVEEPGGGVWEPATATVYSAEAWERLFHPVVIERYSTVEARQMLGRAKHYGPWHGEFAIDVASSRRTAATWFDGGGGEYFDIEYEGVGEAVIRMEMNGSPLAHTGRWEYSVFNYDDLPRRTEGVADSLAEAKEICETYLRGGQTALGAKERKRPYWDDGQPIPDMEHVLQRMYQHAPDFKAPVKERHLRLVSAWIPSQAVLADFERDLEAAMTAPFTTAEMRQVLGYGEQKAPAQVDTLREEACPVCGADEGFNGKECLVCQYAAPPKKFDDPDLEKAKQVDLRGGDTGEGGAGETLACPNCGKTFQSSGPAKAKTTVDKASSPSMSAPTVDSKTGAWERLSAADRPETCTCGARDQRSCICGGWPFNWRPKGCTCGASDARSCVCGGYPGADKYASLGPWERLAAPNPFTKGKDDGDDAKPKKDATEDDAKPDADEDKPEEGTAPEAVQAGDTCPDCGVGVLEPAPEQPVAPDAEAAQPDGDQQPGGEIDPADQAESPAEGADEPDEDDDDADSDNPFAKKKPKRGDTDDDEDDSPFKKKTSRVGSRPEGSEVGMPEQPRNERAALIATIQRQQKQITALIANDETKTKQIEALRDGLVTMAKAAGVDSHAKFALLKTAEDEKNDQVATTDEQALAPAAKDDVESVGAVPAPANTGVTSDGVTDVQNANVTLPTEPFNKLVDVTAPTNGTDTVPDNHVVTDVKAGTPSQQPFDNVGGWTAAKGDPQERLVTSLRLARLRKAAGFPEVADIDDLALGEQINGDETLPYTALLHEVDTLSRVLAAREASRPATASRALVPQPGTRSVPSLSAAASVAPSAPSQSASTGDVTPDEFNF